MLHQLSRTIFVIIRIVFRQRFFDDKRSRSRSEPSNPVVTYRGHYLREKKQTELLIITLHYLLAQNGARDQAMYIQNDDDTKFILPAA